jgi:prevent-host-death family protein
MDIMRTEVGIAELKSRLSEYLRGVRKGGEIVIKDRETPIARLVPYAKPRKRLETIAPTMSLKDADKLPFFRPKGLRLGDVDEALRESHRDRLADFK